MKLASFSFREQNDRLFEFMYFRDKVCEFSLHHILLNLLNERCRLEEAIDLLLDLLLTEQVIDPRCEHSRKM